ncbi:unnamed protein product [[Candida] boidinii]|nr:unnamed protein product [[Candida] boidinii]
MGPLLQTFLLTISFICFAVGFDLPANEVYKISLSKNQESQEYNTIASLFFDNELKSWKVQTTDRNPNLQDGKYCISLLSGTEDQIIKPCFNYRHIKFPLHYKLQIEATTKTSIDAITVIESDRENIEGDRFDILVKKTSSFPVPLLKKVPSPFKKVKSEVKFDGQKVSDSETKLGEEDGEEYDEEPEVEKSFIRKYWMYIVPPLLLIFILSPDK